MFSQGVAGRSEPVEGYAVTPFIGFGKPVLNNVAGLSGTVLHERQWGVRSFNVVISKA